MIDERGESIVRLPTLMLKTVVVHTTTYFVIGVLAYTLGDYETAHSQPPLSYFMRPTTDPLVMAGPLMQPIRGIIFASAFYPLRATLFGSRRGWLVLWWLLVALGILSTFGAAPGSVEGLIYTIISPRAQIFGLWEVILQSLLLSIILYYWVNHTRVRWLNWTMGIAFVVTFLLPSMGLLVGRNSPPSGSVFPLPLQRYDLHAGDVFLSTRPIRCHLSSTRRSDLRHPVSHVCVVSTVIGMSSCEWFPLNQRQIAAWLSRHPEAMPRKLSDLARYPMAFRRVMVNAVSPDVRVELWRQHLETFLRPESPLNDAQRSAVATTIPRLHEILAAPAPNPVIVAWEREIAAVFSRQEAATLFMSIGPPEPPDGIPLPVDV